MAEGDWERFGRRLSWQGIDPQTSGRLVAPARVDPAFSLPRWALTLEAIVRNTERGVPVDIGRPDDALPFEHLLEPAVAVARAQVQARCARSDRPLRPLLSDEAHRMLERALLRRLAALAAEPLYAEFSGTRPYGLMMLGLLDDQVEDVAGNEAYVRFVERMSADGLLGFFCRYPVTGRLLAIAVDQWVDGTAEFLQRLDADADAIERCVFGAADREINRRRFVVAEVETSLSDAHRGGRAVAVLTLADGRKLVYKPKNLSLEVALNAFLGWCNESGSGEQLRVIRVLDRGDYGWAEHVEHVPCTDHEAARRFYRRAGMLLCVLHVLRATDCHHGNVIASGEHPVLVDAETLLHPEARPIDPELASDEHDPITRAFLGSVLRTLFLPAWHVSGDGQVAYDISGLGGAGGDTVPQRVPDWRAVNTDAMALRHRRGTVPAEKNIARVGEKALEAAAFEPEIVAGFEDLYRRLLKRRRSLLREGSVLTAMRELPMRFLFRPTRVYLSVLANACAPDHLRSGARFSIELDHLSRAFLVARTRPAAWPILDAELSALGQLDVPYFAGRADHDALEVGDGKTLPQHFRRSGYSDLVERFSNLDEADLRWQLALIHGSFQARVARTGRTVTSVHDGEPAELLGRREMRGEAERLALELDRRGISDAGGETNWLGLILVAETERVQLQLIGDSLYEGRCGVALFLAALHRVTGNPKPRRLAHAALTSVRRLSHAIADGQADAGRFGGLPQPATLGSMVYALAKIGEFLDDEEPLDQARVLAASLTPDGIATDRAFDVLSGSAGAILGLVSLYAATGDPGPLAGARGFGLHLLEHRISHEGAPRAWRTMGDRPLTGFSHGAAGIAYALLRLYEACGEERFRDAADEAIEYERSVFSPADGNWPDLRHANGGEGAFPDQWCHGAAGIALARLGSRSIAPAPALDEEIAIALHTTRRRGLSAVDHLCCGNAGRIEALWVGAQRMGRREWHDAALELASRMRARARRAGTYQLFPNLPCDVFNPGLFRGAAGIGYQWLRLAAPELPSVLLWE